MGDARLVWAIFAPWVAGLLAALCLLLRNERRVPAHVSRWLGVTALAMLCGGLLVEGPLLMSATSDATVLGLRLGVQPLSRLGLLAANTSLLCAVFVAWSGAEDNDVLTFRAAWVAVGACLVSGLLAASLLVAAPLVQVLCLFAVGVAIAGLAMLQIPLGYVAEDSERTLLALRLAAGLKYLATSALGTGLLIIGTLLLSRYGLSLENRGLLQAGLGLLSVGLVVRSGAMPFSAAFSDMARAAPGVAIMALGAGIPAVITLGLLLLSPFEGSVIHASPLAWLGVVAALLAGLRALYAGRAHGSPPEGLHSLLVAMSAALSLGWALFGALSGLEFGASGASLLAVNAAFAVPLLVASGALRAVNARLYMLGTAVGALSLLGLPPFGGFGGTLMLAQVAANFDGVWLALLLLSSALVAGGWLTWASHAPPAAPTPPTNLRAILSSPLPILVCALIAAQFALFFLRVKS